MTPGSERRVRNEAARVKRARLQLQEREEELRRKTARVARKLAAAEVPAAEIAGLIGVHRSTVYEYLRA